MSKIVKIYCEGKSGSPDFDLLSKVIFGLNVQIVPIGGKMGAKSSIQVREEGLSKSDFKMFFRDRDFDAPVPESERLQNDGSYVYYSYRTTIENYLLDFETFNEYSDGKPWYSYNLKNIYLQAASEIKFFQATRHTLGKLRVSTDFGTNIVRESGILPSDLSEDFCRKAGYEKISDSLKKIVDWNEENYNVVFDEFLNLFDDRFIEECKFLIYFQGKDFMKSLSCKLPEFSPKDYYKYSKSKFDYNKFRDFVELRSIIENMLR
jgi:hypothetical protein